MLKISVWHLVRQSCIDDWKVQDRKALEVIRSFLSSTVESMFLEGCPHKVCWKRLRRCSMTSLLFSRRCYGWKSQKGTPRIKPSHPGMQSLLKMKEDFEGRRKGGSDIEPSQESTGATQDHFAKTHYLSGPLRVVDKEGLPAKPGDLLAVEICNLGPLPGDEWGYTATFDRENGGGFLTDHFPHATKAIWYFEGIYAYCPQIPGVRFPGITHPGVIGTAPSMELLNIWNEREKKLVENGHESLKLCEVLHQRPLASLPTARNCLLGTIKNGTPEWEKIANEAARTIPGRENGGNCDIKNLSRGSKIYLPVFVEGANLSTGDMHFSQGDGEVSFCGAIEMSGFLELKCEIIRGGMEEYLTPVGPTPLHVSPIFEIGPVEPRFSEWLVFEGISVDEAGRQHFLDASVAYKRAVLNAIRYLSRFGYSEEQVYLLLSCCPCEGRISGIVDAPNAVATLAIPTAIFDQDIRPKPRRVPSGPRVVTKRMPDVLRCIDEGGHLLLAQAPEGNV